MTLTDDQVIELHPLHIGAEEDGEREVGRPETGVFVSLPPPGVDLLRWLQEGRTVGEVKRCFAESFGEEPDLADFLAAMQECGFVRVDGNEASITSAPVGGRVDGRGWRMFENVRPERLGWLRTRRAVVVAIAIWLAAPVVLAIHPGLIPSPSDAVIFGSVTADSLALFTLAWLVVFLHEAAHLLVVRSLGCAGSLTLSHRLHYLVAQTDMTSVRSQPRRARYGAYLAGMTCDLAVLLACLAIQVVSPVRLAGAVAYVVVFNLLFQLAFFMRTDVYYVFGNWLRLGNLMDDTRRWSVNVASRLAGRHEPHDLSDVPARELRIVRWYALFCALTVPLVITQFVLLGLPVLVRLVGDAAGRLGAGPGHLPFWDAGAFLALVGLQFGLLGWSVLRDHRRRLHTAAI